MPFAIHAAGVSGPVLSTNSVRVNDLPPGLVQIEVAEGFTPECWWVDESGGLIEAPELPADELPDESDG